MASANDSAGRMVGNRFANIVFPEPGGLPRVPARHDDALEPVVAGGDGEREHAPHGPQAALERKLTREQVALALLLGDGAERVQEGDRDREVEGRSLLLDVRRREI